MAKRKIRYELVRITPAQAKKWLAENNRDNRNMSMPCVMLMARDMRENDWVTSHEPIAFDTNMRLIDGQHRLQAIVEVNQPQEMWVAFDVPEEVALFIDQGRKRSLADAAKFCAGVALTRKAEAVVKAMMSPMLSGKYSRMQEWHFYQMHEEAITFACDMFKGMPKQLQRQHMVAIVARAYYTQDHARIAQFGASFAEGKWLSPGDKGMAMIRDYLLTEDFTANTTRRDFYRRAEYLFECYLNRRSRISKSRAADSELFPIPGEAEYDKRLAGAA